MSSIDLAGKSFSKCHHQLVQRQQLFTAVHESYNKDDDGHDERHHGEGVHGEVDHGSAVAPTERSQRCSRRELFSPFYHNDGQNDDLQMLGGGS